jgi:hypothetical protein
MSDNKFVGAVSITVEDLTQYEEIIYNDSYRTQTIFEVSNDFVKIPILSHTFTPFLKTFEGGKVTDLKVTVFMTNGLASWTDTLPIRIINTKGQTDLLYLREIY